MSGIELFNQKATIPSILVQFLSELDELISFKLRFHSRNWELGLSVVDSIESLGHTVLGVGQNTNQGR